MLIYNIRNLILLIVTLLLLLVLFAPIVIEKYKNKYLYKVKSNFCENKKMANAYMPQKCCYFDKNKKEFTCKDKNCRCKSKETGICEICY
jgi:hypothetical protein